MHTTSGMLVVDQLQDPFTGNPKYLKLGADQLQVGGCAQQNNPC